MKKFVLNFVLVVFAVSAQDVGITGNFLGEARRSDGSAVSHIEVEPILDEKFFPFEQDVDRRCPIGTVLEGNACVDQLIPNCPQGYVWKNERCVSTQTSCPLNYNWDGRSCVPRKICPDNYIFKNNRCVLQTTVCPTGSSWNGNVCETKETDKLNCPPGYIEDSDGCTKLPVKCQSGHIYSFTSGTCVIASCPEGTYREGDRCYQYPARNSWEQTTQRPMQPRVSRKGPITNAYCPEGYTLYNNSCYRCHR